MFLIIVIGFFGYAQQPSKSYSFKWTTYLIQYKEIIDDIDSVLHFI